MGDFLGMDERKRRARLEAPDTGGKRACLTATAKRNRRDVIEITREQDRARAAQIEAWADSIAKTWNVLPTDAETFRLWAKLVHRNSDAVTQDAMIAATAKQHELILVTRNIKDFRGFGVDLLNPFATRGRRSSPRGTG